MTWISVKDRLPEDCEVCLCYLKIKKSMVCYLMYDQCSKPIIFVNDNYCDDYISLDDVLYWMPLPEEPNIDNKSNVQIENIQYFDDDSHVYKEGRAGNLRFRYVQER